MRLLLPILVLLTPDAAFAQASGSGQVRVPRRVERVYVAEFSPRTQLPDGVTQSFTDHFETALVNARVYRVLDRRNLQRALSESKNERLLASLQGLPTEARVRIQNVEQADAIFFGEVIDDIGSGEISITASLQTFDTTIQWKGSVSLGRGLVNSNQQRGQAMAQLAAKLSGVSSAVQAGRCNDFIIELRRCSRADRTISCQLEVTNNGEDRVFGVVAGDTRVVDQNNFATSLARGNGTLAGQRNWYYSRLQQMLLSGKPADLNLIFENASTRALSIDRMDFACWDGESNKDGNIVLRNIGLETSR